MPARRTGIKNVASKMIMSLPTGSCFASRVLLTNAASSHIHVATRKNAWNTAEEIKNLDCFSRMSPHKYIIMTSSKTQLSFGL